MKAVFGALTILLMFAQSEMAQASLWCNTIPPGDSRAPVSYCQGWSDISIRIGDDERTYSRRDFHQQWRTLAESWLTKENLPLSLLDGAKVHYWLSVPEASPLAAKARLEIATLGGPRFMLSGPVFPEDWIKVPQPHQVAILRDKYPDDFGAKAGELLVRSPVDRDPGEVIDRLSPYSVSAPEEAGGQFLKIFTRPLSEFHTKGAIEADASLHDVVDAVFYNELFEWIAWRERAFAFSW